MSLSCSSAVKRRNEVECGHQQADAITQTNDSVWSVSADWSRTVTNWMVTDRHDHRNLTFLLCWGYVPSQSILEWCLTVRNWRMSGTSFSFDTLFSSTKVHLVVNLALHWYFFPLSFVSELWVRSVEGLTAHFWHFRSFFWQLLKYMRLQAWQKNIKSLNMIVLYSSYLSCNLKNKLV